MDTEQIMDLANTQTRKIACELLAGDIKLSNRQWDLIRDAIYVNACDARRESSD